MNRGQWFSSPNKIFLTCVNLFILGIACTIVCSIFSSMFNGS